MSTAKSTISVRVTRKARVADLVVELTLEPAHEEQLPTWDPGAHIDLHLPNGLVRQYSLCGDPRRSDQWRVAVLRDQESRGGSACVHQQLAEGATLEVSRPRNNFRLEPADAYVFIAGGIGITPFLPMIGTLTRQEKPWRLVYGGRSRHSMPYTQRLGTAGAHVDFWPQDERGVIDLDEVLRGRQAAEAVYACGPEGMLTAIEQRCPSTVPLHMERFRAVPTTEAETEEFEVELLQSGRRIHVPADQSLLQALRDADIDVDSSCEEGTCGTCEVSVVNGQPDHRDSVLSPAERESNKSMMICVSRSKCPLLLLAL